VGQTNRVGEGMF